MLRTRMTGAPVARVLGDGDLDEIARVCAIDPVASILAAARIAPARRSGASSGAGEFWGVDRDGELAAVCWVGANLVPVVPDAWPGAVDAFAAMALRVRRRSSSLVGEADVVLPLWEKIAAVWGPAREIRADQPSMTITSQPSVWPDPLVRRARMHEYEALLPACVAMFIEEVGYSPVGPIPGPYEARLISLIAEERSFVRMDEGSVLFKAELGAVVGGVAQVQGVWVAPDRRGQGIAAPGMAAVVEATLRDVAPVVSLYANAYNKRALAAYRRVGFEQVGTYATILL